MSSHASTRKPPQPQTPQSTGDTQYNVRNAALRGASSAFSKPAVKPKVLVNTYTGGGNGALLAATKVGTGTPRAGTPTGTASPLRRDWTGGSTRSPLRPQASPMQPLSPSSSSSNLAVPDDSSAELVASPSNIAAKLAAARFSPMRPIPQPTPTPIMNEKTANERDVLPPLGSVGSVLARLDSKHMDEPKPTRRREARSDASPKPIRAGFDGQATDDTPIAPTTSLVNMFEQRRPTTPSRSPAPASPKQNAPPPVQSPKPQRTFAIPAEPTDGEPLQKKRTRTPPPIKPKPRTKSLSNRPMSEDRTSASIRSRKMSSSQDAPSSPSSFVSAQETQEDGTEQEKEKPKPNVPPPRRSAKTKQEPVDNQTRSKSATPAPPLPKPRKQTKSVSPLPPADRPLLRRASISGNSTPTGTMYHSNYQRESVKAISKHMTGESLSSAIVGAALASSRNVSPARPTPHLSPGPSLTATPPLPTRKLYFTHSPLHRSPSPPKAKPQPTGKLRTTMRKEPSSEESEEETEKYKRKGTRIMGVGRKHPNKHHEGTRKRWRDQITERERKRYEGVWAANKGRFISTPPPPPSPSTTTTTSTTTMHSRPSSSDDDPALDVLNLVVREIWSRSRLPEHELAEVWELVDGRQVGRLKREEFVVGLWLVDQRLKGRKLPIKVSESVWDSVRGTGVRVKVKGDRGKGKHHHTHRALVKGVS